mmetsp:Transcript_94728/g.271752  ORF Transcript_94728/g.271752 Transcript_94728/m.271752 type:complete len:220 (-) Transcript_94728:178-837(-)
MLQLLVRWKELPKPTSQISERLLLLVRWLRWQGNYQRWPLQCCRCPLRQHGPGRRPSKLRPLPKMLLLLPKRMALAPRSVMLPALLSTLPSQQIAKPSLLELPPPLGVAPAMPRLSPLLESPLPSQLLERQQPLREEGLVLASGPTGLHAPLWQQRRPTVSNSQPEHAPAASQLDQRASSLQPPAAPTQKLQLACSDPRCNTSNMVQARSASWRHRAGC